MANDAKYDRHSQERRNSHETVQAKFYAILHCLVRGRVDALVRNFGEADPGQLFPITRPLHIERQQPLRDLFVAQVVGPAVGVQHGPVEFLVGQV